MTMQETRKTALIVGAGAGLSASLTRKMRAAGMNIAIAARDTGKLAALIEQTGATPFACDAAEAASVAALFAAIGTAFGAPDVVVYNPSFRVRGPLIGLDPAQVWKTLEITAFGGFLVGQEAAKAMLPRGSGKILFTGASASVKGYAQSAPFAMGKFALRGLAQSMARELGPQGIHVAHFVIDGGIASERRQPPADKPDSLLDPDAIADTYLAVIAQPRSAWTHELEVRPFCEIF
jgi:NAD(P)-dependent dehydrogenase (short-subunit alcohol dehydrogenase family)